MKKLILFVFLGFFLGSSLFSQRIGIYHSGGTDYNTEEAVRVISEVVGMPSDYPKETLNYRFLQVVLDLRAIHKFDVLFLVDCNSHPIEGETYVEEYLTFLNNGGILIADINSHAFLDEVFGVSIRGVATTTDHQFIGLSGQTNAWLDDSLELKIPLCKPGSKSFSVGELFITTASPIAFYEDSTIAISCKDYGEGKGKAYFFAPSLKRLVTFPRNNRDLSAQRTYSNGFEPGADIIPLMMRGIIEEHFPVTVWKHTLPKDYKSVLTITHEVDSKEAYEDAYDFLSYEKAHHIPAHFFLGTKYFEDSISGAYYVDADGKALANALLEADMTIGSHSVGGFSDFDDKAIFPLGALDLTKDNYSPFDDGDTVLGGSVLGEVLVSKRLLEEDVRLPIKSFRSGRMKFNKLLPTGLEMAGYTAESSFRANDVMTGFPYFLQKDQSSTGLSVDVLEIPVHISDKVDHLNKTDYVQAVDIWEEVIHKYSDNYAPVTLAMDPDKDYKLAALDSLLQRIEGKTELVNFEDLNDFWRERHDLVYLTHLDSTNTVLTITIPESILPISSNQSLHINKGKVLDSIIVVSDSGFQIAHRLLDWDEESYLLRFESAINDFIVSATEDVTCVSYEALFSISESMELVDSLIWDFGDGFSSKAYNTDSLTHTYLAPGEYQVGLCIFARGVVTSLNKIIEVALPSVSANFAYNLSDANYRVPLKVDYLSAQSESEGVDFLWTNTNGDFKVESTERDFDYEYTTPGVYTVTLKVSNNLGCWGSHEREITVKPYQFVLDGFDVDISILSCDEVEAHFVVEAEQGVDFDSLLWDFGDGSVSKSYSASDARHRYDLFGVYNVSLILWNHGEFKVLRKADCVNFPSLPVVTFSLEVNDTNYYAPLDVQFNNTTVGDYQESNTVFKWIISSDDGYVMKEAENISHTFDVPGAYRVAFAILDDNGCYGVLEKDILVKNSSSGLVQRSLIELFVEPNPTNNKISINLESNGKPVLVEFYNMQGVRLMQTSDVSNPITVPIISGVCLLRVTIDGQSEVRRIVKF